jgi:hypothetical protein
MLLFTKFTICSLLSFLILLSSCGQPTKSVRSKSEGKTTDRGGYAVEKSSAEVLASLFHQHKYEGMNYRDPFIPLSSSRGIAPAASGAVELNRNELAGLSLKGILEDSEGEYALLVSPAGYTYILKKGRLVNQWGKVVPNVVGMVKKEEVNGKIIKKVTLLTQETKIDIILKEE